MKVKIVGIFVCIMLIAAVIPVLGSQFQQETPPPYVIGSIIGNINDISVNATVYMLGNPTDGIIEIEISPIPVELSRTFLFCNSDKIGGTNYCVLHDGCVNLWHLAKGNFERDILVEFDTGEVLSVNFEVIHNQGDDTMFYSANVNGSLPYFGPNVIIEKENVMIDWVQQGTGNLMLEINGLYYANGNMHEYHETIFDIYEGDIVIPFPQSLVRRKLVDNYYLTNKTLYMVFQVDLYPFDQKPEKPSIEGENNGKIKTDYSYQFIALDPHGDDLFYFIDWADGSYDKWIGPYDSGEEVVVKHIWDEKGAFRIRAMTMNLKGLQSNWKTLEVTMSKNKQYIFNFPLLSWLFQRFPNAFPILRYMLVI